MANPFLKLPLGTNAFQGYHSPGEDTLPSMLAPPSQNCLVTQDGKVESRLGYQQEFVLGASGFASTCFYHKTYDLAFFALDTKVFYRDFTTGATVDTGITLTTGTVTRFSEIYGDLYLTNTTDGPRRIVCGRVNDASAVAGDATITVDSDFATRLSVFGINGSGNLRINGTDEAYNAVDISTGIVTLVGTLSQSYSDNAIVIRVHDIHTVTGIEKPSKIEFWENRLHLMGFPSTTNADQPNNSVICGQFVAGQTGTTGIEKIIDFTYGTGGSTKILVGTGGKLTNILGEGDNFWFFTEDRAFATASADVVSSGSAIGLTKPDEKDRNHGCINEDCAIVMGSGDMGYVTNDRRIMRKTISTVQGAAIPYADESFDIDIRDHLKNMDADQTGALAFYYRGQRKAIFQLKILGQWYWFIFDYNVSRQIGSTVVQGAWQPPQNISPVTGFFERNGVLFGTDASTDIVYSFFTTFTDNLSPIQVTMATGEFNVGNAMLTTAVLEGEINQPSQLNIRCFVWNNTSGKRSGSPKVIDGSQYSYSTDNSVGAVPVGGGAVGGASTQVAKWKKQFGVFPSQATRAQIVLTNEQDGSFFSLSSFGLSGAQSPNAFDSSL